MQEEESRARTYWLFAIVVLSCALGALSQTAVNSMVGGVCADFGITESVAQWLTTAYMLVLGITVPVVTYLSRRLSMRALALLALGFLLAGAALAFVAWNFESLMAGRVLQAISTGITMPLAQTIAMTRFPKGKNATAMGISGIAFGFAPNIGPTIGGALVDTWGWHSFFVLLAAAALLLVVAALLAVKPRTPGDPSARLDVASLALSTVGFGGLLFAFSNAANYAPESPLVWAPFIVGVAGLIAFVTRQKRVDNPLVSLEIFSSRRFVVGFVCLNTLFGSFLGITLIVPLYVMNLVGGTALEAGMVFLPALIPALVCNPLAGILSDKIGVRPVVVFGCVFLAAGSVSMAFLSADSPLWLVAALQFVRAMGVSSLIGPFASWSLAELPRRVVMDGSAFSTTTRQVAASLGTAIMVLIITLGVAADPTGAAAWPYQLALGFSALLAVATAVVGIAKVR